MTLDNDETAEVIGKEIAALLNLKRITGYKETRYRTAMGAKSARGLARMIHDLYVIEEEMQDGTSN